MPDKVPGWSLNRTILAVPPVPPWVTGRFYDATFQVITGAGTVSPGSSSITATPIFVPNLGGVTVTAIGCEVTTGTANHFRVGLYTSVYRQRDVATPPIPNLGMPDALVIDSGSLDASGTGFISSNPSTYVRQGWYWLLFTATGGTYRNYNIGQVGRLSIYGSYYAGDVGGWQSYLETNDSAMVTDFVTGSGLPGRWQLQPDANPLFSSGGSLARAMVGI